MSIYEGRPVKYTTITTGKEILTGRFMAFSNISDESFADYVLVETDDGHIETVKASNVQFINGRNQNQSVEEEPTLSDECVCVKYGHPIPDSCVDDNDGICEICQNDED
jgi:hypothetical protein